MMKLKVSILAVAVLAMLIIVLQNTQEATVRVLLMEARMPMALLLALMLAGGFVCGLAAVLLMGRKSVAKP